MYFPIPYSDTLIIIDLRRNIYHHDLLFFTYRMSPLFFISFEKCTPIFSETFTYYTFFWPLFYCVYLKNFLLNLESSIYTHIYFIYSSIFIMYEFIILWLLHFYLTILFGYVNWTPTRRLFKTLKPTTKKRFW